MSDPIEALETELAQLRKLGEQSERLVDVLNKLAYERGAAHPRPSRERAEEALTLARNLGYRRGEGMALANVGFARNMSSENDVALPLLREALSITEEVGDDEARALALASLASVELNLGNYDRALETAHEALKAVRKTGKRTEEGWCLYALATGYFDMKDFERSLRYYEEALALSKELGNTVGRARSLTGIGSVQQSLGNYEEALRYHRESLAVFESADTPLGVSRAHNDLGVDHLHLGDREKAREHLELSLRMRRQIGNPQAVCTSLINLGRLHIADEQPERAVEFLTEALDISTSNSARPKMFLAHEALSEAYEHLGDAERALRHHKAFQQLKEEVTGDQAIGRIKNLIIGYEVEKSEQKAEMERMRRVELKEKNAELTRLLAELNETQAQLVQSEKMAALGSLVAGLVHELNTPIGAIKSTADLTNRCVDGIVAAADRISASPVRTRDEQLDRSLRALRDNGRVTESAAERLTKIVDGLKGFARLDEARIQKVDLHEGLESALTLLEHRLRGEIGVDREYGDLPSVVCDPGEINQVFMHLLNNAIDAMNECKGGRITIRSSAGNGHVQVAVSDTGVGLSPERMERIFEPGFSRSGARVKAGLGLFTVYNIVRKHHGDVHVASNLGEGTTFTVVLPVDAAPGKM